MKPDIRHEFHHIGKFTADHPGRFRIRWHRFTADSPLHPLIRTVAHPAFKVDDLAAAIADETVPLGPMSRSTAIASRSSTTAACRSS